MTVYEQIKNLSIPEMATLIAQMVDHEDIGECNCPIGVFRPTGNEGYCKQCAKGCDESALAWLQSEDQLYIDVPLYLTEGEE